MTELEAIELELINRELAKRQQQKTPQEDIRSSKMIPQFIKGLYETLPFGKRVVSMLPNAEQIEQQMATTPKPQGFLPQFARGAGAVAPDLAMSIPFMKGAKLIPKIPAIAKSALGFGTYGGTKAALQGENIPQRALESAGSAALFHGAGRIGASFIPRALPFAERIGSAIGGGIAGQVTGGEEGMALGAGLGAMYPAQRLQESPQANKMAELTIKNLLKPKKSLYNFGKNPERAIVKEGILGANLDGIDKNAEIRINELNQYKDRLKFEAKNMGVKVDLTKNKAFKPIEELITELNKAPESHKTTIKALQTNLNDLTNRYKNLNNLTIDEAYELRDIVNSLKPSGIFSRQSEAMTSKALHQTYHNIVEGINNSGISPDLKLTNKRISDLITAREAIQDATNRNSTVFRFIPLGMFGYGLGTGNPLLIGAATGYEALKQPAVATTVSKMLSSKYPKIAKISNYPSLLKTAPTKNTSPEQTIPQVIQKQLEYKPKVIQKQLEYKPISKTSNLGEIKDYPEESLEIINSRIKGLSNMLIILRRRGLMNESSEIERNLKNLLQLQQEIIQRAIKMRRLPDIVENF